MSRCFRFALSTETIYINLPNAGEQEEKKKKRKKEKEKKIGHEEREQKLPAIRAAGAIV